MSELDAPPVSNPVKMALVIRVELVRTKSSADSISILPPAPGRVAVAILPSGSPVLKKNGAAAAGSAARRLTVIAEIANPGMYGRMIPSIKELKRLPNALALSGKYSAHVRIR